MKSIRSFEFWISLVLLGIAKNLAQDSFTVISSDLVTDIENKIVTSILEESVTDISNYEVTRIVYTTENTPYWNGIKFRKISC